MTTLTIRIATVAAAFVLTASATHSQTAPTPPVTPMTPDVIDALRSRR